MLTSMRGALNRIGLNAYLFGHYEQQHHGMSGQFMLRRL